jgi:hypothetical protein
MRQFSIASLVSSEYRRPLFYSWRFVAVVVASKNGIRRLNFHFGESSLHKFVASSLQVLCIGSCGVLIGSPFFRFGSHGVCVFPFWTPFGAPVSEVSILTDFAANYIT